MQTALIISQSEVSDPIPGQMIEPFRYFRRQLRHELGLRIELATCTDLEMVPTMIDRSQARLIFLSTSWRQTAAKTLDLFITLRRTNLNRCKIVYLDSFDQSSSPFFAILPYVDLYVKKQLLKDRSLYLQDSPTGYCFADYAESKFGVEMTGWHFGSVVDSAAELGKITLGWNLGTSKHLSQQARRKRYFGNANFDRRPIDISYRSGLVPDENKGRYYNWHRRSLYEALRKGSNDLNIINSVTETLPRRQFWRELRQSKLSISPFGWGEVTYRDFEIALNAVALVKPDMSHLETEPNIFVAGETYIRIKWDASDLVSACEYYLKRPAEAEKIALNAQQAYQRWFIDQSFLDRIKSILDSLNA